MQVVAPDVLVEIAAYQHSLGKGRYIVTWRKVGGQWYLEKDIFNA
jgi:hypothetical protein